MIENFAQFASKIKEMSTVVGASKSTDIVGTKFRSLLSISGDIQLGSEFKASLNASQLEKFAWMKDDDLTIRGGVITIEGLDGKPKAFWLNTAILSQLAKARCLTDEGDILPAAKGIQGEFYTDSVKFAKPAKKAEPVAEAVPVGDDDDSPF